VALDPVADVVDDLLCEVVRDGVRNWCGFFAGFGGEKEVREIGIHFEGDIRAFGEGLPPELEILLCDLEVIFGLQDQEGLRKSARHLRGPACAQRSVGATHALLAHPDVDALRALDPACAAVCRTH
jgi:hypothetical protein